MKMISSPKAVSDLKYNRNFLKTKSQIENVSVNFVGSNLVKKIFVSIYVYNHKKNQLVILT
jgi:hypothetical protein